MVNQSRNFSSRLLALKSGYGCSFSDNPRSRWAHVFRASRCFPGNWFLVTFHDAGHAFAILRLLRELPGFEFFFIFAHVHSMTQPRTKREISNLQAVLSVACTSKPVDGRDDSNVRNFIRALCSCDLLLPIEHPSIPAISLCSYPSTIFISRRFRVMARGHRRRLDREGRK